MARKISFYLVLLAVLVSLAMCKSEKATSQTAKAPLGFTDTPVPTVSGEPKATNTPQPSPTASATRNVLPTTPRPTTQPPERTPVATATKKKESSHPHATATTTPIPTLEPVVIPSAGVSPGPEGLIMVIGVLILALSLFFAGLDLVRRDPK